MVKKRTGNFRLIIVLIIILAAVGAGVYFLFFSSGGGSGETYVLANPAEGLSDEEAAARFDESFVVYLLYSIGANELKNVPFTSNTPKIEFYIGDDVYNAEIVSGSVNAGKGAMDGEDIIIRTSAEEAVKMIRDKNYISESFSNGGSGIELIAGKTTLFTKGYLGIYTKLTGNSVTGSLLSRLYD